jgi:DNA-binding beta-propeller fold protein YncE
MRGRLAALGLMAAALLGSGFAASAQMLMVGNDEKVNWDDKGATLNLAPGKDTILFLDIAKRDAPRIAASLQLENSIFGPPVNLQIHPKGEIALVANSVTQTKDGDNWKPVPDNKLYVFDLTAKPVKQIATVETGKQPSGLAISKKGDLALVTNRADNSITVLSISGKDVKVTDTIAMGDSVAAVAISPDGKRAIAVKPVVNKVALLKIDGQKVTYDKVDMVTGVYPYNVDITPNGKLALVANNGFSGGSDGNVDTVSVIDLEADPPHVIDQVMVGDAPEGFAISPKGDLAVALLIRGSNSDKKAWYYHKSGSVVALKIAGKKVTKVGEVEVGALPEGVAFSPDGASLYVGNFIDQDLSILHVNGTEVSNSGKRIPLHGHPASLRGAP